MKIKANKTEIKECVRRAVTRLLTEIESKWESDELDREQRFRDYKSGYGEDKTLSVPSDDSIDKMASRKAKKSISGIDDVIEDIPDASTMSFEDMADDLSDGDDDALEQAMIRSNEKPLQSDSITFTTDLDCDDDVDSQIMDELEDMFDAEVYDDGTITVDSSVLDELEDYFREHQIQASKE